MCLVGTRGFQHPACLVRRSAAEDEHEESEDLRERRAARRAEARERRAAEQAAAQVP